MDDSRVKNVGSLLRAFFDEDKIREGSQYADFFSSWKAIVGSREAGHSRVADIDKGILIVEAEHPGWIQLLQIRQSAILAAAQARFPELCIRGIAFRLAKDAKGSPPEDEDKRKVGPFGPGGRDVPDAIPDENKESRPPVSIESISDPELRARLAALKKTIDEGKKAK